MKFWLFVVCLLGATMPLNAQTSLTLSQCLTRGIENNLSFQQIQLIKEQSANNLEQTKLAFFPSLNANNSWMTNFGASFDPQVFSRINKTTHFSNPSLLMNITLFNGLIHHYANKQAKANLTASVQSEGKIRNDLLANIALTFLKVVISESNKEIAESRYKLIKNQLERTKLLVSSGSLAQGEELNAISQLATEESNLINVDLQIKRDKLTLAQLLNLNPLENYVLIKPAIMDMADSIPSVEKLISQVLNSWPDVLEQQARVEAALWAQKQTLAGSLPSLSLNASLNSNYSSNGGITKVDSIATVQQGRLVTYRERASLPNQFGDNFNQSINVNLSIPIFNRGQVRQSKQNATLNIHNAELQLDIVKQQVTQEVIQAWAETKSAMAALQAAQAREAAANTAYDYAEKRHQSGSIDFFRYLEALNNLTNAQVSRTITQYDWMLKRKMLDLYLGKELTF